MFRESFDVFTVLLLMGSVVAGAVVVRCVFEVRGSRIAPLAAERALRELLDRGDVDGARAFAQSDQTFVSRVHLAADAARGRAGDAVAVRDAAELAASEETAAWFRKIEPLNVIGNLGPLLGLAGTVWGMVLAFSELGQAGGQANPATLSAGISKALFHTLLGLMLALPALTVFGFYRTVVDRHCNRAMVVAAELVDALLRAGGGAGGAGAGAEGGEKGGVEAGKFTPVSREALGSRP